MKIGVFGGAFDPIHEGHVQIAKLALEFGGVDRVVFLPTAFPPHKTKTIASFNDRLAMLEMVVNQDDNFLLSSIEGELPSPSYTIQTLKVLKEREFPDSELFFIIGSDAFLDISVWKDFDKLLETTHFILIPRKGEGDELKIKKHLETVGYIEGSGVWQYRESSSVLTILPKMPVKVSSSQIRKYLKAEDNPRGNHLQIPLCVLKYIDKKNLYKKDQYEGR